MKKIDLRKDLKPLYSPGRKPVLVDVPELTFAMVDGHGDPNVAPEYVAAVESLFTYSYTLKFAIKASGGDDWRVMPLEGLWWSVDMDDFVTGNKANWDWTMMIAQPVDAPDELRAAALERVAEKLSPEHAAALRIESFTEGRAAQVMYTGPYADEGPTIVALHEFIGEQGLQLAGKHHEIYLSDPRRADPANLKTIIRQPAAG